MTTEGVDDPINDALSLDLNDFLIGWFQERGLMYDGFTAMVEYTQLVDDKTERRWAIAAPDEQLARDCLAQSRFLVDWYELVQHYNMRQMLIELGDD